MAGRYDDWFHRRGGNDRPDLVSIAKKLLGYLEEQRQLTGVKTQSIERKLPDGSIVRASFFGDIPKATIITSGGEETTIEYKAAIITWPGVSGAVRISQLHPQEAMKPPGRGSAGVWGHRKYKELEVDESGNIDWRDFREEVVLSWRGPKARYFKGAATEPFGTKVYYNGAVVYTVGDEALGANPVVLAGTNKRVEGACVNGTKLLVVVRSLNTSVYYVLATSFINFVAGTVWTLIGTRPSAYPEYGYGHSVFFNSKGTEGRTIRVYADDPASTERSREVIFTVNEAVDAVTFSFVDQVCPSVVNKKTEDITHYDDQWEAEIATWRCTGPVPTEADNGNWVPQNIVGVDEKHRGDASGANQSRVTGYTAVTEPVYSVPDFWIKSGVDYKNDVPNYMYLRKTDGSIRTESGTRTPMARTFSSTRSVNAPEAKLISAFWQTYETRGSVSMAATYSESYTSTYTSDSTAFFGGIKVGDNIQLNTHRTEEQITTSWSYSSNHASTQGSIFSGNSNRSGAGGDGSITFSRAAYGSAMGGFQQISNTSSSGTVTRTTSTTATVTTIGLLFVDLRTDFVSMMVDTQVNSSTSTGTTTGEPANLSSTQPNTTTNSPGGSYEWRLSAPINAVQPHAYAVVAPTNGTGTYQFKYTGSDLTPWHAEVDGIINTRANLSSSPGNSVSQLGVQDGFPGYHTVSAGSGNAVNDCNAASAVLTGTAGPSVTSRVITNQFAAGSRHPADNSSVSTFPSAYSGTFQYGALKAWALDPDINAKLFVKDKVDTGHTHCGAWKSLRGHWVYSQVAGPPSGVVYLVGTTGPPIHTLDPKVPVTTPINLYHPMFVHTKLR